MSIKKQNTQKKTKMILVIAVSALWFLIFFKVFKMLRADKDVAYIGSKEVKHVQNYNVAVDSFALLLNYKDPFRARVRGYSSASQDNKQKAKKKAVKKQETKPEDQCVWEQFLYGGTIKNNEDNSNTALVKISGRSFFVEEKDIINQYQINKIYSDSIVVKKDKCVKTFYRKNI